MGRDGHATESSGPRYGCIGCLMLVAGAFGGGMIAVLVAKFVGSARGCNPGPDLPACDWHVYAAIGMLIGAVTLPLFTLMKLRKGEKSSPHSK